MKTRLVIIRHAEAEGNMTRVFHGWTDGEITEKGHVQAQKAAQRLADMHIDILYSSSLKRTMQTAQYISEVKNLPIIRTDKLKEINGGDWEGVRWKILPVEWPVEYETWEQKPHIHQMPNGESMEQFQKRIVDEIKYIINFNKGKTVCIVTHGTAIKSLMCFFTGCSLEGMIDIPWYDNTAITIVNHEDGEFKVSLQGDASHLDDELSTIRNQPWWPGYIEELEGRKQNR